MCSHKGQKKKKMAATGLTLDGLQAGAKPRVILQFSMPGEDMNPVR